MDEFHDSEVNTAVWIQDDGSVPADGSEEQGESLGIKILHFVKLYWKKRKLASIIIGTGIVLSVVASLLMTNVYTSTVTLMPPENASPYSSMLSMLTGGSSAASLGGEALGISSPGELIVGILGSRTVQDALITKFGLISYYKARKIEDARRSLDGNTFIDQDRKSGIITLKVTDDSAQFASKLAQGYVTELNRVMMDNSTSAARRERIFLEGRLKEVKSDLDGSSRALSQFSTKSKAFDIPAQAKSMVDAELKLEGDLAEGRAELAATRQTYSDDNYRVKAIQAENAELEREINQLSGLSKKAGTSDSGSTSAYPSIGELPALGVTYYDLERQVRVDEALWDALTKQYELARVQEAKEIPTIQVLDAPNVPNYKSAPRRTIIVIVCTFLSFVLSGLVVLILAKWESMDADDEPRKTLTRVFSKVLSRIPRRHRSAKQLVA
jgi:capsule polysaccharide export protein KpsE/RkpR